MAFTAAGTTVSFTMSFLVLLFLRQNQAKQLSNSSNKLIPTMYQLFLGTHNCFLCPVLAHPVKTALLPHPGTPDGEAGARDRVGPI